MATAIGIFQRPGSNALATAATVLATMEQLAKSFPQGMSYRVAYDTTQFIQQSVDEVIKTLFEAVVLVVIVIILFLQTWRAAIIPIVAIPVSLIGTFLVMTAFGFSLNNLTLFGLVLAIGIVVDDAIVVVENVERYLRQGMSPREAAHKTMDEVGGALIAIALVLCAVFIPSAFITGISGAFYRQFALTIAASTIISAMVSLTLSPALAALLLKPHGHEQRSGLWKTLGAPLDLFFARFNRLFEQLSQGYGGLTRRTLRISALMLVIYGGLIGFDLSPIRSHAIRFYPATRPRLFHYRDLVAAGCKPRAHRSTRAAGIGHAAQAARRRPRGRVRRVRRRHLHQRPQCRRYLRHLAAVRRASEGKPFHGQHLE